MATGQMVGRPSPGPTAKQIEDAVAAALNAYTRELRRELGMQVQGQLSINYDGIRQALKEALTGRR